MVSETIETPVEAEEIVDAADASSDDSDDSDDGVPSPTVGNVSLGENNENTTLPVAEDGNTQAKGGAVADGAAGSKLKQSRNEKKSRKALLKLGMKPVPGITKVLIKRSKHIVFVVNNPDVYKAAGSDSYIIFGEAKIEDSASSIPSEAAKRYLNTPFTMPETSEVSTGPTTKVVEEAIDESSIDTTALDILMKQVNCTRTQAIKALKDADNDVVEAILKLSDQLQET